MELVDVKRLSQRPELRFGSCSELTRNAILKTTYCRSGLTNDIKKAYTVVTGRTAVNAQHGEHNGGSSVSDGKILRVVSGGWSAARGDDRC